MSEGMRSAFIENDVIGNVNAGTSFLGGVSARKSRRKVKKRRKKSIFKRIFRRKKKRRSTVKSRKRVRRVKRSKARKKTGIHYTKKGQPYKILANGRARFIKGKRKKRR